MIACFALVGYFIAFYIEDRMQSDNRNRESLRRLLALLRIPEKAPSLEALTQLVSSFLITVPFENVSKLYYLQRHGLRGLPGLEAFVDGSERYHFGGTCYSNNYYLHLLLKYLGYDVALCGADMANPDVHLVNIVRLKGREFLVDAGYAAPFLQPMPRDLTEQFVVALGRDRYVLSPRDEIGRSHLEMYRNGELKHGYSVNPTPRQIEHFTQPIRDSYRESATFMNSLLLTRFFADRSLVIYNLSLIESKGATCQISQLPGLEVLPETVERYFSIPSEITAEAIAFLGDLGDAWS